MASLSSLKIITAIGQLLGTSTNDTAAAGNVGEELVSRITSTSAAGADATYFVATSLVLTAGCWDVIGSIEYQANGATFSAVNAEVGVSRFSGSTSTGLVRGDTRCVWNSVVPITFSAFTAVLHTVRVYCDGTNLTVGGQAAGVGTTLYLKGRISSFSAGQPDYLANLRAVRVR